MTPTKATIQLLPMLAALAALSACSDRLDGQDQPRPPAPGQSEMAAATDPRPESTMSADYDDGEEIVEDADDFNDPLFADEEDYGDGPVETNGFDPTPRDFGGGIDPAPVAMDSYDQGMGNDG